MARTVLPRGIAENVKENDRKLPLCVDLDGTLIRVDLLYESTLSLLKRNPLYAFRLPFWLLRGRSILKNEIAERTDLRADNLPYNRELLDHLREQKDAGRRLILATGSHRKFARAVADHLGLFDEVYASDGEVNLSGETKAKKLDGALGRGNYDYAGNGRSDLAVWESARAGIVVDAGRGVRDRAARVTEVDRVIRSSGGGVLDYVRALRPHQWVKNLLILVPLVMAHRISDESLLVLAWFGFLSFGLCASSVYLLNDLMDLEADRDHPRKRNRPLASGAVPVLHALLLIPLLLAGAIAVAMTSLPSAFLYLLLTYYALTLVYSFWWKAIVMVDVLVLAGLYTIRIVAGGAAVSVPISNWLAGFSIFFFLSLAMVKRYSELHLLREAGGKTHAAGRGYRVSDLPVILGLGSAAAYGSVLLLALYVNSSKVTEFYSHPEAIWLVCPVVLFWISRVWILAGRGKIQDDPVLFAVKDPASAIVGILCGVILWLAS